MIIYREETNINKLKQIISNARLEDKLEAMYLCGTEVEEMGASLLLSTITAYASSNISGCFYAEDGAPLMVYGFIPSSVNLWTVWAVCTNNVEDSKYRRSFLEESRIVVADTMRLIPSVTNVVWSGNKKAMRWLKWVGAKFDDNMLKYSGEVYYRFVFDGGLHTDSLLTAEGV